MILNLNTSLALARQLQAEEEYLARRERDAYLRERHRREQIALHQRQEEEEQQRKKKKKDCIIM